MADAVKRPTGTSAAMTPERWRAVDAILRGALSLEAAEREAFVRDA
jgi:hypothetical protein